MNPKTAITFDEFLSRERERLAAFRRWWRDQQVKDPKHFPEKMNPGDWTEQLDIYDFNPE